MYTSFINLIIKHVIEPLLYRLWSGNPTLVTIFRNMEPNYVTLIQFFHWSMAEATVGTELTYYNSLTFEFVRRIDDEAAQYFIDLDLLNL